MTFVQIKVKVSGLPRSPLALSQWHWLLLTWLRFDASQVRYWLRSSARRFAPALLETVSEFVIALVSAAIDETADQAIDARQVAAGETAKRCVGAAVDSR